MVFRSFPPLYNTITSKTELEKHMFDFKRWTLMKMTPGLN